MDSVRYFDCSEVYGCGSPNPFYDYECSESVCSDSDVFKPDGLPSFGQRTEAARSLIDGSVSSPRPILGCSSVCGSVVGRGQWSGGASSCSSQEALGSIAGSPPKSEFSEGGSAKDVHHCVFCRKNGEQPRVFKSHTLHTFAADGRRIIQCPVLRSVRCVYCGASGDNAHTVSHCPIQKERVPVAILLKSTPRQCDGSLRRKAGGRKT